MAKKKKGKSAPAKKAKKTATKVAKKAGKKPAKKAAKKVVKAASKPAKKSAKKAAKKAAKKPAKKAARKSKPKAAPAAAPGARRCGFEREEGRCLVHGVSPSAFHRIDRLPRLSGGMPPRCARGSRWNGPPQKGQPRSGVSLLQGTRRKPRLSASAGRARFRKTRFSAGP